MMKNQILLLPLLIFFGCSSEQETILPVNSIAAGWKSTVVAEIDQSYAGWDVEIGDADNDKKNEILVTGCPNSRLYISELQAQGWTTRMLADNLAQSFPGMGLVVKVVDLNLDGRNEIILGTGQENGGIAFFYLMTIDGGKITKKISSRPEFNSSSYTHNLAFDDTDNDGLLEVISAYCGGGEIIRYDFDQKLENIKAEKLYQLSGSGEESIIADVDNDGQMEYLSSNSFRRGAAKVEIFEFDSDGKLIIPPRLIIDGYDNKGCFYASFIVGDVDNNGRNELVVGWKQDQNVNKGTILGYHITETANKIYTFSYEDTDLDMSYFEKMMCISDANNDGKNELILSTRGDNMSEKISSDHLGNVFQYTVSENGKIEKKLLVDLNPEKAESSWLAVGDADNDGLNEIVLATGKGDRTKAGISYVLLLERNERTKY
jgi:hypothetical protein